jgi:hypothetical protein
MFHYLTLGHLDVEALQRGEIRVLRPLDMTLVRRLLSEYGKSNDCGGFTLGGYEVNLHNGYVSCPWLMARTVSETEQFARRLISETGCIMAEAKAREVVSLDSLRSPDPAALIT